MRCLPMDHVSTREKNLDPMSEALAAAGATPAGPHELRFMKGEGNMERFLEGETYKIRELRPRAFQKYGDHDWRIGVRLGPGADGSHS